MWIQQKKGTQYCGHKKKESNLDNIIGIITNAVRQKTLDKVFITQKFIEYQNENYRRIKWNKQ